MEFENLNLPMIEEPCFTGTAVLLDGYLLQLNKSS
jgi:hypothetical protein